MMRNAHPPGLQQRVDYELVGVSCRRIDCQLLRREVCHRSDCVPGRQVEPVPCLWVDCELCHQLDHRWIDCERPRRQARSEVAEMPSHHLESGRCHSGQGSHQTHREARTLKTHEQWDLMCIAASTRSRLSRHRTDRAAKGGESQSAAVTEVWEGRRGLVTRALEEGIWVLSVWGGWDWTLWQWYSGSRRWLAR